MACDDEYYSPQYARVSDGNDDEEVEVPTERDGKMLLSTLQGSFPNATGLRYRGETGAWRALRQTDKGIDPPAEGWACATFMVVMNKGAVSSSASAKSAAAVKSAVPKTAEVESNRDEPFDDGPRPADDIVILGLSHDCRSDDLKEFFGQFGKVVKAQAKVDYVTKQPKGFGFVCFEDKSVVDKVVGSHEICGKLARVEKYVKRMKECRLFVGRLPHDTTKEELEEFFSNYGNITNVLVPREFHGFAFVTFEDKDDAIRVLKKELVFKDKAIKLDMAAPRPDRDGPSPRDSGPRGFDRPRDQFRGRSRSPPPSRGSLGLYGPGLAELDMLKLLGPSTPIYRGIRDRSPPPQRDSYPPRGGGFNDRRGGFNDRRGSHQARQGGYYGDRQRR